MVTQNGRIVVRHATCTYCGCVCDDIDLTVEDNKIVKAANACVLGKAWFLNHNEPHGTPAALIKGRPATAEDAIERAARILARARYPLVFGLSNTTNEAQRYALEIAEMCGGCIDTTTSVCHGPTEIALQGVGKVAATLGEVKNRADLLIYWGSNPAESHPRHLSRYTYTARGLFTPNGKKDRTMVLVDVRRTPSARAADEFIQIRPGTDFEALWILRALARGQSVTEADCAPTGIPVERFQALFERMKNARYGVLFFGMGLSMSRGKSMNSAAIFMLAADMNRHTKFLAMPMRGHGNVTGVDELLTWSTGYPFAVNFSRGYPRFNPGEFTAVDVLARREADAALIVSSDPYGNFPRAAREHLASIPVVILDVKQNDTSAIAEVHITTAPYGIAVPGTVYRMDEIPIRLRAALESPYPSDEAVLRRLAERIKQLPSPTWGGAGGGVNNAQNHGGPALRPHQLD